MSSLSYLWKLAIKNIVLIAQLCVFGLGSFYFGFGCGIKYESEFRKSIDNENFLGAKRLIQDQIARNAFNLPGEESIQAFYKLAYVHGRLGEYDSVKTCLDICVERDGNFSKRRREMLEFFSLDEFNKAVFLYNNFFFDKAIAKLKIAVEIVGTGSPYEEYSAVIYRCLAYAEASNNSIERALDYCKKAAELGDVLSKRILAEWEKEKKIKPPEKLEPRENRSLTI